MEKYMEKAKRFFRSKAGKAAVVCAAVTPVLTATSAFCADDEVVTSMTTAFSGIQSSMLSGISAIAPIGLVVAGAILLWKFGVRFFKSLAK